MPIHEYQCPKCGYTFEHFSVRAQDAEAPACPACGAGSAERIVSPFSCGSGCSSGTRRFS